MSVLVVLGMLGIVLAFELVSQGMPASAVACPGGDTGTGCPPPCPPCPCPVYTDTGVTMNLQEAVFNVARGIAGFETGTLDNFDPNDTTLWKGAAKANNNPGNLRAPGASTGFRTFALPINGWDALIQDLTVKFTNKTGSQTLRSLWPNWSIVDLISVYDSDPKDVAIAHGPYSDYVAGVVGVDKAAPISTWVVGLQ